jgi:hypothetical protein
MKTAVKPQAKAPAKTASAKPAAPPSAPPRTRSRVTPLTPMRVQAAKSMSRLADNVRGSHPDLPASQHLMDAARTLRQGNEEASQRHLRAAMFSLTPQSLMRNGQHTDDLHIGARSVMHDVHRHLLLVKDITDVAAKNQASIRRDSYDDDSGPMPQPPAHSADPNAGYGPGALAQKPTARQPGGDRALNAPNRSSSGGSDPNVADPVGPQPRGSKQFTTRNGVRAVTELAYGWGDLDALIEMSAETGRLASTPAPRGKPGGPGLYGVRGNMHSPYMQQIVKALIEKRGMDPGKAYAIAWEAMRKWSKGGGKVHPEVRAAAAGGLGLEKVAEARAHAHANTWDEVAGVVELAAVVRVPAGQAGGGQFGAGGTAAPAGKTTAKGKPPVVGKKPLTAQQQAAQQQQKAKASGTAKATAAATMAKNRQAKKVQTALNQAAKPPAPDPHQQHVAHMQQLQAKAALKMQEKSAAKEAVGDKTGGAQSRAGLLGTAKADRAKANTLIKQRKVLMAELASASGATSSGQSGSTTTAGASTTASTAPAVAATPAASTAASSTTAASSSSSKPSAAQLKTAIAGLTTQITSLLQHAALAQAQAAKMGSAPAGKTAGPPVAAK